MALLPTGGYSAQLGGLPISGGRRADAESPVGTAARDFAGGVAKSADVVLQTMEETETRKAAVSASQIRATYAKALDDAATSGADLDKLKEQMQADLAKAGEDFQTRKGTTSIEMYTANATLMFNEQANHIAVQRAFAEAKQGASTLLNSESSILQSNPTYLPNAIENVDRYVDTLTGIRPDQRAAIRDDMAKDLNMAAVLSRSRIDPEGTRKQLDAGEFNLHPHQRDLALSRADAEIRSRRVEDAYMRADQERVVRERDEDARDKHFGTIMDGTATTRAIMDDPDLRPATREHLINYMNSRAKELRGEVKASDPKVVQALWLAIHAPSDDPTKIYNGDEIFKAVQEGKVNTTDADKLNTLVANQKDENGRVFGTKLYSRIQVIGAALRNDPSLAAQPELQASIQLELSARVEKQASRMRSEKKSPDGLLDPESPDYFFKPGTLKGVADDVKAQMRDAIPKPPTVATQAEYDALPDGAAYVDSSGKPAVKRGKAKTAGEPKSTAVSFQRAADDKAYAEEQAAEASTTFQRLRAILSGEKPTRESNQEYRQRKGE